MTPLFRIGATSFVLPDRWLPNVEWLAGRVDDVELLLFDASELPDAAELAGLERIAALCGTSYTVHLPLERGPGWGEQAGRALAATAALRAERYVVHLDCADPAARVELLLEAGLDPASICVENLAGDDLLALRALIEERGLSVTLDLGHLLRDGRDVLAWLERWLPRTRVIHWHGVDARARDHRGLDCFPGALARAVIDCLLARRYHGVLTLELFEREAFERSLAILQELLAEVRVG